MAWAKQKAKIFSPQVEVYEESDFDSEIIGEVHQGETYFISDKIYGPFYRIQLKNGKVGYIVDYELDIEGVGRIREKDLDEVLLEDEKKILLQNSEQQQTERQEQAEEEAYVFGKTMSGPSLQLVNFRENTMGADQIDNLFGLGYKSVSEMTWSVLGSYGAPKYYASKAGESAKGLKFWADLGFTNTFAAFTKAELRYAASVFTQVSLINVDTPARKYDLHDITAGVDFEVACLFKINNKKAIDLAIKFYFDKSSYSGLALSYLF